MPSGPLVLVELKTRWSGNLSFSHVVQLPARRVAVEGSTVQPIASEAFVGVRRC
jgi:hypothetical protein